MTAKKKFGMGLNKTEKKGKKKILKNKMKMTNLLTVINVATKTLKNQKPLDIMSAIKVARKSIHQSMGSKKNVKKDYISSPIERVIYSFLSPIVRGKELRNEKTNFSATQ